MKWGLILKTDMIIHLKCWRFTRQNQDSGGSIIFQPSYCYLRVRNWVSLPSLNNYFSVLSIFSFCKILKLSVDQRLGLRHVSQLLHCCGASSLSQCTANSFIIQLDYFFFCSNFEPYGWAHNHHEIELKLQRLTPSSFPLACTPTPSVSSVLATQSFPGIQHSIFLAFSA